MRYHLQDCDTYEGILTQVLFIFVGIKPGVFIFTDTPYTPFI